MFNLIAYIKDVIDLVKNPPGKAVAACEITPLSERYIREAIGPEGEKYIRQGDFYLEFERNSTIVPVKEFHKHYAFDGPVHEGMMTPVRTIKPL